MNPELVDAINMLMEAAGLSKLADVVDEADLISQLKGVSAALGKTPASEPEDDLAAPPPEGGDMATKLQLPGMAPALADTLRKTIKALDDRVVALSNELASRKQAEAKHAKDAFNTKVGELLAAGVAKTVLDGKKALADKLGTHDLALLDGLAPVLNTGNRSAARKLADPNPPNVTTSDPDAERNEIAARVAKARNISLADALKLVP